MIVFDLHCELSHTFEGWFASADDFTLQKTRGLVQCPICDSSLVERKLSAPRLNLGAQSTAVESKQLETSNQTSTQVLTTAVSKMSPESAATVQKMQALWMEMAKQVVANTEDVGSQFADEARKIHYNEAPDRNIRGVASADEAAALREEGIDVHAFPMPAALKGSQH